MDGQELRREMIKQVARLLSLPPSPAVKVSGG